MSYPGNASLAQDIQVRILDTFKQTLKLVESESVSEAKLGCDFILRLDPMFEPARWLQDRLDNSEGEIVLDDLREAIAAAESVAEPPPAAVPDADESFSDLADLADLPDSLDAPIVEAAPAPSPEPPSPKPPAQEPAATQATYSGAEAPVPATAEEVMASPVVGLDTESEQRIQDLLSEGQAAFERAEYQSAIDAWSRIFLIDIDHPEANERIELARKLKAEAERTVEEAFHEALEHLDNGRRAEGRAGLEKVLEMQPDHMIARERLDKLDIAPGAAEVSELSSQDQPAPPPLAKIGADLSGSALDDPDLDLGPGLDVLATPSELDAPTPGAIPIPKPRPISKASGGDRKKLLLYVGVGVLFVVLVAGWLLMSNWSRIFPNSSESAQAAGADRPDPIERAEALHAAGKTSTAIAQLRRLPPDHALHSEAQALVAQWEAEASAGQEDEGPTEEELLKFASLVDEAKRARTRGEFLRVDELLTAAALIQPLDEASANLKLAAEAQLEPIQSLIAIFKQGEWELALRDLWRLREEFPDNPDVSRLMVDSYYNLGVRALQRGDTASAAQRFTEALEISPEDPMLERVTGFAQTYQNRPEDLLYKIFVKYLPFR